MSAWAKSFVFHLRKWYFDAVSPDGRVAIAYAAWLRMGPLRWKYSAVLLRNETRPTDTPNANSTFGEACEPEVVGDVVRWSCGPLNFAGVWSAAQRGPTLALCSGVEWNCLMPRATVRVETAGERWQGVGYVERIDIRVPPWRLPIDELRWGRWIGDQSSIVWIEWKGRESRRWLIHNTALSACFDLGDSGVRTEQGGLALTRSATLRDAELGASVLAATPCLRRLAPARMVNARETKWLSQGVWRRGHSDEERGWAIHEVVTFSRRTSQ